MTRNDTSADSPARSHPVREALPWVIFAGLHSLARDLFRRSGGRRDLDHQGHVCARIRARRAPPSRFPLPLDAGRQSSRRARHVRKQSGSIGRVAKRSVVTLRRLEEIPMVGTLLMRGMLIGIVAGILSFGFLENRRRAGGRSRDHFRNRDGRSEGQGQGGRGRGQRHDHAEGRPGARAGQPPGAGRHRPVYRRHGLQHRVRRPLRAGVRSGLSPHGRFRPENDGGVAGDFGHRRGLCRSQPEISGQSAVGRRSRNDRHAHAVCISR